MRKGRLHDVPWLRIVIEGVMIVTSILLALAVDAWWDGRRDRAMEASYLRMLAADLRETLANNEMFSARADSIDWAGARLVQAHYDTRLPPGDSLGSWARLAFGTWQVQPTLGTAETLASTGDLRVIRNDSLRTAITQYVTYMRFFDGSEHEARDEFHELRKRLLDRAGSEFIGLLGRRGQAPSPSDDLYPYPAEAAQPEEPDLVRLVRDGETHLLLWQMNEAKRGMRINRERMRSLSQQLLDQIEAAQAGR